MTDPRPTDSGGAAPAPDAPPQPPPLPRAQAANDARGTDTPAAVEATAPKVPLPTSTAELEVPPPPALGTERLPQPYWNSYAAGIALGLVLLAGFVFTGRGLGASGAVTRVGALALQKVEASVRGGTAHEKETYARANAYTAQYINDDQDALDDFLVYLFIGVVVGGFASGLLSDRTRLVTERGPHTTVKRRLVLALVGGFVSAFGARLARGCTSGQALTGGATLALGSWAFMLAVFAGGYAIAYFVRKEWL